MWLRRGESQAGGQRQALRLSPLLQMSLALVALCGMLIVLADVLFGVFPDRAQEKLRVRKQVGEAVAVQVAALLRAGEPAALQATLAEVARRTPGVRSLGLRRADGVLVLQAGSHDKAWAKEDNGGASTADRIDVPMQADGRRWGSFELAFEAEHGPGWLSWLQEPMVATMGFIFVGGLMAFSLYMRRALQHLDPAGVIPERVQGAFDAMAEGVAVLDNRGRVLLTNRSFRGLNSAAAQVHAGQSLSNLPWLAQGLGSNAALHPWMRAMGERTALAGQTVQVTPEATEPAGAPAEAPEAAQQLVINAAPILDSGGRVRGCLATFSDMTPLHRANEQLRQTLAQLSESQEQVQRQNEELRRLATRDPMTGCLNRRAFTDSYENMFRNARINGLELSCLVLDIDFFKKVNDTHGHSVGDRVIQEVARRLQDAARPSDLVCRYGGEEFCVVLPGLGDEDARRVGERMRACIEAEAGPSIHEVPGMRVTVSVGVAGLSDAVVTPLELIDRADHALYASKKGGRNQVRVHGGPDWEAVAPPVVPRSDSRQPTPA